MPYHECQFGTCTNPAGPHPSFVVIGKAVLRPWLCINCGLQVAQLEREVELMLEAWNDQERRRSFLQAGTAPLYEAEDLLFGGVPIPPTQGDPVAGIRTRPPSWWARLCARLVDRGGSEPAYLRRQP